MLHGDSICSDLRMSLGEEQEDEGKAKVEFLNLHQPLSLFPDQDIRIIANSPQPLGYIRTEHLYESPVMQPNQGNSDYIQATEFQTHFHAS